MKKYIIHIVVCLLLFNHNCIAQIDNKTLSLEQVFTLIRNYHPVVKLANIEIEKSKADILLSRSAFDPILQNYITKKTFNGIQYYQYTSPEITIPTWYGIEVVAGLENLSGTRFDVAESEGKTSYMGLTVPLVKNLVIDKRRAYLQQAKLFNTLADIEKRDIINNIMFDAADAYWQWVKAYKLLEITNTTIAIITTRTENIKRSLDLGEVAAIDTLEAYNQLLSFELIKNKYELDFQQAGLLLSNFLWKENNVFYGLPVQVVPENTWDSDTIFQSSPFSLENVLQQAEANHPQLQKMKVKNEVLVVDRKLKFQELLPKVDFKYNVLSKGYNALRSLPEYGLFQNNFQYGIKMEMPLRLSSGRAMYKIAQLKIQENNLEQEQKKVAIALKIKKYYTEYLMYKKQIQLQAINYLNFKKLLDAEEIKFANGESNMFLINTRETKALETLQKLIDTKMYYYKAIYGMQWSAGLLQ